MTMASTKRAVNSHVAMVSSPYAVVSDRSAAQAGAKRMPVAKSYQATPLPDEIRYVLTREEKETIHHLINDLPSLDKTNINASIDNADLLSEIATTADERLPRGLRRRLRDFQHQSNEWGSLLIRNLPTDPVLPPTPISDHEAHAKETWTSEYSLLLVMTRLGDPRGYQDEKRGDLVQNIFPIPGRERRQENSGSASLLEFHTEDGFLMDKADFLGLICLRTDHESAARTGVASVSQAMSRVSGRVLDWLREPLYEIAMPLSFTGDTTGEPIWSDLLPVLSGDTLHPELNIDLDAMRATSQPAQHALEEFGSALMDVVVDCVLGPGDLLVIDNRTAAHVRTGFTARYDGHDRWLQRAKVVIDPRSSQKSRRSGSRVCGPMSLDVGAFMGQKLYRASGGRPTFQPRRVISGSQRRRIIDW